MITDLLTSRDLDRHLRYPRGRSVRLARRGLIPHIELPDGEIRFDPPIIERWLAEEAAGSFQESVCRSEQVNPREVGP